MSALLEIGSGIQLGLTDLILCGLILIFCIYGFAKGFIAMLFNLLGLAAGVVLVIKIGPMAQTGLMIKFGLSNLVAGLIAYLLIFAVIVILAKIIATILEKIIKALQLNFINRVLGMLLGGANGFLALVVLFAIVSLFPTQDILKDFTQDSVMATQIQKVAETVKYKLLGNEYNELN